MEVQAENRNTRRLKAFTALQSNVKLTREAREWLTLAVDPYHDYKHQVAGYPDADTSATIVSCYNYAVDVAKPAGVVGNWDCHVFNLPKLNRTQLTTGTVLVDGSISAVASPQALGFFNVVTNDAGGALFPNTSPFAPANYSTQVIDVPFEGQSRVIGAAFEIINTTGEMYKQGTLTAYKMPVVCDSGQQTLIKGGGIGPTEMISYRQPPSSVSQAMLLNGTVQWHAKDGAYVVMSQSSVNNPLTPCTRGNTLLQPDALASAGDVVLTENIGAAAINVAPAVTNWLPDTRKMVPFNISGAFITGLSSLTTLRVTLKVFVEKAPTFSEPDLAVLATPSAPYDERALTLYSALWTKLPVAVPVHENGFGDWWKRIMKVVSAVAGPLGLATGNPAVGAAIAGTSGALSTVFEAKKVNKAVPKAKKSVEARNASAFKDKEPPKPEAQKRRKRKQKAKQQSGK